MIEWLQSPTTLVEDKRVKLYKNQDITTLNKEKSNIFLKDTALDKLSFEIYNSELSVNKLLDANHNEFIEQKGRLREENFYII